MLRSILYNSIHFENRANSQLFKVFLPITQAQCVPVQNRVRVPDESWHEVRHDPDILASSPDRYKGR
jgi:hypothetical protein